MARRRKPAFKIDLDEEASRVLNLVDQAKKQRQERIGLRMERYEKLRGWLPGKQWPWENCANFHFPIMLIYSLRTKGALENAVKAMRPMLNSRALQRRNAGKQNNIDKILDFQFFVEGQGEKFLDSYISNFVDDEAVFAFTKWVRKEENYRDIRVLPRLAPDMPEQAQLIAMLKDIFDTLQETGSRMLDNEGWDWEIEFADAEREIRTAKVSYYEREDGKIEAHISYMAPVYDGPSSEVMDFEDVVFPIRSGNTQPPGPENPHGAPWIARLCKTPLDAIKRGAKNKTYDLLDKDALENIESMGRSSTGSGKQEEEPKEQKDRMEGTEVGFGSQTPSDRQVVEWYGRADVDGDGFEEDVIYWIEESTKKMMKAVYLSEMYPGLPIRRPISSESFIPVPNRIYGISLPEILEAIQEMMQMLLNQHIDWGTLVNAPFFFYRASSGMKPEIMHLEPGDGIPLDDPPRDVLFPQFQQRGDAYTINTITLLQQFAERLSMISDVQFGRVPTGKSAALRTYGTTMSLIAQGDVRSEQILRRLFHGLSAVYQMMHRLNKRYLPERKEIRMAGMAEQGADPYTEITREEIQGDVDFDFKATLLNTNRQVLSANISEAAALLISPLAIQAGIVTEDEVYRVMRDKIKALDLPVDEYLQRPPNFGPRLLLEDALDAILSGEMPQGRPLEAPEEHMQKLLEFEASDKFGFITGDKLILYQAWKQKVQKAIIQRQLLMKAAEAMMGGGNGGPGGVPSTMDGGATSPAENPPIEKNEKIDESLGV